MMRKLKYEIFSRCRHQDDKSSLLSDALQTSRIGTGQSRFIEYRYVLARFDHVFRR